jgi:hypothetical protein
MFDLDTELTKVEKDYLMIEMNCILRSYGQTYNGQRFDNEHMGSGFNKVFKALSGRDHEQYVRVEEFKKQNL